MKKKLIVLFCILIFLRPHFDFTPAVLSVYFGDIILFLICIFSLLIFKFKVRENEINILWSNVIVLIIFFVLTCINILRSNSTAILIDYIKLTYYIFAFWTLYQIFLKIESPFYLINELLDKCFYIIFIIALIQLIEIPFLVNIVHMLFGTEKLRSLWSGYLRVYSTFYNANWLGIYLVYYLSWINSTYLYKTIRLSTYIKKIVLLVILFVISGSRTALIGAAVSIVIQFSNKNGLKKIIKILPLIIIVILLFNSIFAEFSLLEKTLNRFSESWYTFLEGDDISELNVGRWDSWNYTWNLFQSSPIFGTGYMDLIPHNSFLYILNMFGFIGFLILSTVYTNIYIKVFRNIPRSLEGNIYRKWHIGFIPTFLLMNIAGDFVLSTQIMLMIIFLFVGSMFTNNKEEELLK